MTEPDDLPIRDLVERLRAQGFRVVRDGAGRYFKETQLIELARGRRRVQLIKEYAWGAALRVGPGWFSPGTIVQAARGVVEPLPGDLFTFQERTEADFLRGAAELARHTEEALRYLPRGLVAELRLFLRAAAMDRRQQELVRERYLASR
jgi:hypothetical protein